MNYLTIHKRDFYNDTVSSLVFNYLENYIKDAKTVILDIHNTIEFGDGEIDNDIYNFIKENHKTVNIIFLSYDGNEERINVNNNILNNHSKVLAEIPKIFIKKRKKHFIIAHICTLIKKKFNTEKDVIFIDDNLNNINDANKFKNTLKKLTTVHYVAHVSEKHKDVNGVTNIKNILS